MLKKFFARLIWVPVGLFMVVFLVSNRQPVAVNLDPFSVENSAFATPALPLWVWFMLMLLIGFFLGAATSWISNRHNRRQARADHKELKRITREKERAAEAVGGDALPVLKTN